MLEANIVAGKGIKEADIDNIIEQTKKIREVEYNFKDHF